MAYTLLWTSLERYAGLRYHLGKEVKQKVRKIANEAAFAKSLRRHVKARREVYSIQKPSDKFRLDPDDPEKSINYYYQVRCNTVHRGKAVVRDYDIVRDSLEELLNIFKDMLEEAWDSGSYREG